MESGTDRNERYGGGGEEPGTAEARKACNEPRLAKDAKNNRKGLFEMQVKEREVSVSAALQRWQRANR